MDADEIRLLLAQNPTEFPNAVEVRQRILALEIKRNMPATRRLDSSHQPAAL